MNREKGAVPRENTPLPTHAPVQAPNASSLNPWVATLLANNPPPQFSGEDVDWDRFAREWVSHESIVRQLGGDQINDFVLFHMLRSSLDKSMQDCLERRRRESPNLSFSQFWQEFEKNFRSRYGKSS